MSSDGDLQFSLGSIMPQMPAYVTEKEGGAGFAEFARALMERRNGKDQ